MLRVYNTLTGKKEEFKPLNPGEVRMYVCGLTVQNYSHLGHIRSAVNYDVIRRYLEYKGYQVTFIQNFTDINEKIVARAQEEGLSTAALAEKYAQAYLEDIDKLNIKRASSYVRATENIAAIIELIQKLIDKGYAYEVNGNVYFSVEKFKAYGKLSGRNLNELEAGARIEVMPEKKNPLDFALWKKAPEGEINWDSPWGKGWPGWHIECSAMSMKYLGESFDIHGGGSDLIFPHHENEIAQSEACTGKVFAKYWLHNGSVNFKGEKMSKSLGNFFTTRELLKRFTAEEIRYYLLTKHYRSPIDFSLEEIKNTSVSLERLINTARSMQKIIAAPLQAGKRDLTDTILVEKIEKHRQNFVAALDDDFNSAKAIAVLHEMAREINSFINSPDFSLNKASQQQVLAAYNLFTNLADVLGLSLEKPQNQSEDSKLLEDLLSLILEIREKARQEKNWQLADWIRDGLNDLGFTIKDTPRGVEWERDS